MIEISYSGDTNQIKRSFLKSKNKFITLNFIKYMKLSIFKFIIFSISFTTILYLINLSLFFIIDYWAIITTILTFFLDMILILHFQQKYSNEKITIGNSIFIGLPNFFISFIILYMTMEIVLDKTSFKSVFSLDYLLKILFEVIRFTLINLSVFVIIITPIYRKLRQNQSIN
jgi:hypothetical protein